MGSIQKPWAASYRGRVRGIQKSRIYFNFLKSFCVLILAVLLPSCIYHPPVYQGNVLTQKSIDSVHRGMTMNEVVTKLGSPVLKTVYADDRITYVYQTKLPRKDMRVTRLYIDFERDRVIDAREF